MSEDTKQILAETTISEINTEEIVNILIKEIIDNAVAEIASSTIETANTPLPVIEEVEYTASDSFVESIKNSIKDLPSDNESPLQDTCSVFAAEIETADTSTTKVAISDTVIIIQDSEPEKKGSCTLFFEKITNAIKRIFKH